ncbi:hypothetical protein DOO74_11525 [Rhodobacteraceae bacterium AsT-22]|nr:hypothetical protein DOO74_11525 [Rhodobacteraceae bacterium AsT-22]
MACLPDRFAPIKLLALRVRLLICDGFCRIQNRWPDVTGADLAPRDARRGGGLASLGPVRPASTRA